MEDKSDFAAILATFLLVPRLGFFGHPLVIPSLAPIHLAIVSSRALWDALGRVIRSNIRLTDDHYISLSTIVRFDPSISPFF